MYVRSLICYRDFCRDIEDAAANQYGEATYTNRSARRGVDAFGRSRDVLRSRDSRDFGTGYNNYNDRRDEDQIFSSTNIEKWYSRDATPREQEDFKRVYSSLDKFRSSLEEDDFLPPKPTESMNRNRLGNISGRGSGRGIAGDYSDLGASGRYTSPLRSTSPIAAPRSPPSKVGTIMWGSDTPLSHKGVAPSHGAQSHWVCGVCYFTENSNTSKKCEVCDSPDYSSQKVKKYTIYIHVSNINV
jgi:hypothetical protein